MQKIPLKVLYGLLPVFIGGVFLIDSFLHLTAKYNINFNISIIAISIKHLRELMIIGTAVSWFLIIKRSLFLNDLDVPKKLWGLTILLGANFVTAFLLRLIFGNAEYLAGVTPDTGLFGVLAYVFFMNEVGFVAILTLIPVLIIMRDLIFYRQRRTTRLYFNFFLLVLAITSVGVYYRDDLFNLSGLFSWWDDEVALDLFNTLSMWSLTIAVFLLSFRNDWITYLSRKQKILYFSLGIIIYTQIYWLWEKVYALYLPEYSLLIANFGYLMSHFLVIYGGLAMLTLFMHLPTARAVDRKLKELRSVYEFNQQLNSELNERKLLQLITQLTASVLESQSTWLVQYNLPEEGRFKIVSHINLTQNEILNHPFKMMSGFNKLLVEGQKPILINDLSQNRQLNQIALWKKEARAFIAAPLFSSRDQLLGIIYATRSQPYGFDIDDISLLESFAKQAAIALENNALILSSFEKERLEQELKVAREVQLKLVPQVGPTFENLDIDSFFLTAYEVGGDYFDYFRFADQQAGVVIGDVSGKGTSAAFYMAEFKGVIRTLARSHNDPHSLVCQSNQTIYSLIEKESFVTAIVGKFDHDNAIFHFVRAGHTPVFYYNAENKRSQYLQPPGLGIGLESGEIFKQVTRPEAVKLQPDDFLVLFTDGLVELRNAEGMEFGDEQLQTLIDQCDHASAYHIKEAILNGITDFVVDTPLHDDLTFIVIKYVPVAPESDKVSESPSYQTRKEVPGKVDSNEV